MFNDYPVKEYTQVSGNGEHLLYEDDDIVCSIWKHIAVLTHALKVTTSMEHIGIIDLEKGSDYVDALKVQASSVAEIRAIGEAILKAGKPYKYIAVDTITALEELCIPFAEELYSKSAMGSKWFTEGKPKYGSILNLANGAGERLPVCV